MDGITESLSLSRIKNGLYFLVVLLQFGTEGVPGQHTPWNPPSPRRLYGPSQPITNAQGYSRGRRLAESEEIVGASQYGYGAPYSPPVYGTPPPTGYPPNQYKPPQPSITHPQYPYQPATYPSSYPTTYQASYPITYQASYPTTYAHHGYANKAVVYDGSCCLDFPTNKTVTEYGYDIKKALKPITDTLLFDTCPADYLPATLCQQATALFTSTVGPQKDAILAVSGAIQGPFNGNRYTTSLKADLAIVNAGGCFNVYPNVLPGQTLTTSCVNDLLGPGYSTLLDEVFSNSIYIAGNLCVSTTPSSATASCYIGGDFLCDAAFISATASATGPNDNAGLVIGGYVEDFGTPSDISATVGDVYVGGADSLTRIDIKIRLQDPVAFRYMIAQQVCALSRRFAALETTDLVVATPARRRRLAEETDGHSGLSADSSSSVNAARRSLVVLEDQFVDITFTCNTPASQTCVIEINAIDLSNGMDVIINANTAPMITINVLGPYVSFTWATLTGPAAVPVIWNFVDAQIIDITVTAPPFIGIILAPVATQVTVNTDITPGGIVLGNPNALLTIDGIVITAYTSEVICPDPIVEITLCRCLCASDNPNLYSIR